MQTNNKRDQRLRRQAPTLSEALDRYIKQVSSKKRGGYYSDVSLKKTWEATMFSDRSISAITQTDLVRQRDMWLSEFAPATVVRRLALISHLYTVAIKDWGMTYLQDPSKTLRRPIVQNERTRRVINDIQIIGVGEQVAPKEETFWILRNTKSKSLPTVIQLALETALRRSEIVNIKRADINFSEGYINIPKTKNGRPRQVPLSPWAKYMLIEYLVKCNKKGKIFEISAGSVTRSFQRARSKSREQYERLCKTSGLEPRDDVFIDLRFHDLRHEATSRLAEIYEMHELAKITGHADTRQILRYYHPNIGQLTSKLAGSKIGRHQFDMINKSLLDRL